MRAAVLCLLLLVAASAQHNTRHALAPDAVLAPPRFPQSPSVAPSLLAVSERRQAPETDADPNALGFSEVGMCEVCVYVIENKSQNQPYLCRGLKDKTYQQHCVQVMESLMWWLTNEVYWLNYGCQRTSSTVEWVRPCPAHAVCSWLEHLYLRKPFCPVDPQFQKPQ